MNDESESGLDRLSKLANYLEEQVSEDEFDMECIFEKRECGSAGCALGYATRVWPDVFGLYQSADCLEDGQITLSFWLFNVKNGCRSNYDALFVQLFFEINGNDCEYLFGPNDRSISSQIKLMRDFVVKRKERLKDERPIVPEIN